jgi:hypothetical protein
MRSVALLLLLTACETKGGADPGAPTYHAEVRPIIERSCADTCHSPGGVGPLDLSGPVGDEAPPWAAAAAAAVAAGTMPPWQPADGCRDIDGNYDLTQPERDTIAAWAAAEFPMGDEADYVAPAPVVDPNLARRAELGAPTLTLRGETPYQPDASQPDDYRCIPLDHTFDVDTFIRGMEIDVDKAEILHHLILYMYYPEQDREIEDLRERDAEDPDVGFTCFENPPADTVLAWAPGQLGEYHPDTLARYVPPGAVMFLQIHYNSIGRAPTTVPADQTGVTLWTTTDVPQDILTTLPFANTDIFLPAGDPDIVEKSTLRSSAFFGPYPGAFPVVGVMAHMHQLGSAFKVEVKQPGTSGKDCMLDIPDWDFAWQRSYFFPEESWVWAEAETEFSMTCEYDNSPENQIVVNGEPLEPRDVTWGENTTDEMCLTYLLTKIPSAIWLR